MMMLEHEGKRLLASVGIAVPQGTLIERSNRRPHLPTRSRL